MKLILGGYGVMGRVVEGLALERGHEIVGIFSLQESENAPYPVYKDIRDLPRADAIIDFSHPKNTSELLRGASHHKTPIVVATTGARDQLQDLMDQAAEYCPIFFSANMSYGVHVFTKALKFLTPLLSDGFDIEILERHHNKKIDAPSGTAIALANDLIDIDPSYTNWAPAPPAIEDNHIIPIVSVREGQIPGYHGVTFTSQVDRITIEHEAFSRKGLAQGVLLAADYATKHKGALDMKQMLDITE